MEKDVPNTTLNAKTDNASLRFKNAVAGESVMTHVLKKMETILVNSRKN